jgi:DNA-binding response OmpR family regulator
VTSRSQQPRCPARALVIAGQRMLADTVKRALGDGPYNTRIAQAVDAAAVMVAEWRPHLVIVDMDTVGRAILERLADDVRGNGRLPVIGLTRRGDLDARLDAFHRGVDDILTVPFSPEEFIARVLAIMRRTYREATVFAPVLRIGDLQIDIPNHHVRVGERELHLTMLEQSLLYLLAANAGRLLTRDEILNYLWGSDYVAESNVVDRHIRNLRVKLHDHSRRPTYIATVPGRGYRFLLNAAEAPLPAPR